VSKQRKLEEYKLCVIGLPMRTSFRGLVIRETALVRGETGWGEFAPFIEYSDQESLPWLESALEAADKSLSPALREFFQLMPQFQNQMMRQRLSRSFLGIQGLIL